LLLFKVHITNQDFGYQMTLSRRTFLKSTAWKAAALSNASLSNSLAQTEPAGGASTTSRAAAIALIDTNVHLFEWPFRRLKYARTAALAKKLRQHGVRRAWAGTFEGLLAKDIRGANDRLVEECQREGNGLFVPIGSVNPMWPDWEEDLQRCHHVYGMPGIRLHPGYHGYALDHPDFKRLLQLATSRRLLVQIALGLEDPRVQHPLIKAPLINPQPLVSLLKEIPDARVQLLNSWQWTRQVPARPLLSMPNVTFDIAELEGVGSVRRMLEGKHWYYGGQVPLERLLFGSHAPYFPVEATLLRMFESPLSFAQMQAIMETNARRLIPLG
jgi:predicted TIM-barrel fold metal-dependent hydrolase